MSTHAAKCYEHVKGTWMVVKDASTKYDIDFADTSNCIYTCRIPKDKLD